MNKKFDEILKAFENSNLSHLKYQDNDFTLELSKDGPIKNDITKPAKKILDEKNQVLEEKNEVLEEKEEFEEVKSPMLGIFYTRMSPDEDPLVKVGDYVKKGQVLCVIEAMKMFNEVTSPFEGVIKKINFKDEDMVEFDSTLFEIDCHA